MLDFRNYRNFARNLFYTNITLAFTLLICHAFVYYLLLRDYPNPHYIQTNDGFVFGIQPTHPELPTEHRTLILRYLE